MAVVTVDVVAVVVGVKSNWFKIYMHISLLTPSPHQLLNVGIDDEDGFTWGKADKKPG